MDIYQSRYLEHKENKMVRNQIKNSYNELTKESFKEVMKNRKSVRRFNDVKICEEITLLLDFALLEAPSSCNRKGIYYEEVDPIDAERILVGGTNWVGNASKVFFLYGAKDCYKNPVEIPYMPYLDAGFAVQNIYLLCELHSIGCCFINPNKREELSNDDYFVGAIAIGDYDV